MESTIRLIDLLGAVALLMWGLRLIKTGVLRAFGATLRQWIARGTRNRFQAALSGFLATIGLQSSTATAVIAASFAGRGLIEPAMAQAVMLGPISGLPSWRSRCRPICTGWAACSSSSAS